MKSIAALYGHVGNPGELKTVGDTVKLGFTLATNRREKKGTEWIDVATWWTITVWGKRAETLAGKLSKGLPITVHGEPYLEEWTTTDGTKRQSLRLRADDLVIHAARPARAAAPAEDPAGPVSEHPPRSPRPATAGDEEPPF